MIKNIIDDFVTILKGEKVDSKELTSLETAQKLFKKVLSEMGNSQEDIDLSPQMAYSYKARNPLSVTEKEFNHHYWAIANNLISKEEIGILNSSVSKINNGEFFNKNADGFYMIPVGKNGVLNKIVLTDGKNDRYSIDTIIEINSDNETELSIIRETVYESESKGIQTENSDLFKVHYAKNYEYNDFKRKSDTNLSNSDGKQDRRRSNREAQFSLKDSQGNTLSEQQREFFKDSKVRDEDGNLLVMYHGTDANFTVFDISKAGKNGRQRGWGFYFTNEAELSKQYGDKSKTVYLDIKKPLYTNDKTIKLKEVEKFVGDLVDNDVKRYEDEELTWQDSFMSNYVSTYE